MNEPREQAELAYQRAISVLHDARAELAEVMAARRRLVFDRTRLEPAVAGRREAELETGRVALVSRVERLRAEAEELRSVLRRMTDAAAEPAEIEPVPEADGFEQPPFLQDRP